MKHYLALPIILCSIIEMSAQTSTTTYKNKSGNPVGYSKTNDNKTTYYDESHNKTGSAKINNGQIIYYNREGNKVGSSKRK